MLNQVCLVGVVNRIECINKNYYLYLDVKRNFKNFDGNFDVDTIKCRVWKGTDAQINLYAPENKIISVEGRIEAYPDGSYEIVCYDVMFIG